MGWLDSFICDFHIYKLQVIFRKRATDYMALLRKTTCKDKASNGSSYCMNKSSQPTYEWVVSLIYEFVISHMNESCHTWMSHVTHGWVMSRMIERRYVRWWSNPTLDCWVWMKHVTYEWDMSHMNESYHKCMSHVTYKWVMCVTYSSFRSLVQCIAGVPLRNGRAHARCMI